MCREASEALLKKYRNVYDLLDKLSVEMPEVLVTTH